jgi:FkbM family methyltransferase
MILNFLRKIKFIFLNTSYSQAGEDAIIRYLFNDYGLKKISYLDLGTNKPNFGNNTYWFYTRNCRGVCVEANPELFKQIKTIRRKDIVLNLGISTNKQDSAPFYIFNETAISTFDKNESEKRINSGKYKLNKIVDVKLKSINTLISENFTYYPDFLSIDIEGLDYNVLDSLNVEKFPIPVICVETCLYSEDHIRPKNEYIVNLMKQKGYEIYADTYINTIFINKKWFYKI